MVLPGNSELRFSVAYGDGGCMPHEMPVPVPVLPYTAGDILVVAVADGFYQVSRVSGNGRSTHVMSVQNTQPAAIAMARRSTSGNQRVFLRAPPRPTEYLVIADV